MIDTHCHIDDPQYAADMDAFLADQKQGGVEAVLVPGVDADSIGSVLPLCRKYPQYLFAALGLHPENVRDDWRDQLQRIHTAVEACQNSPHPLVAIGEIGLDYHFDTTFRRQQQQALHEQLAWAEEFHLPVMIHSRDATEDCLRILREHPALQGVMHCFNGSREVAEQVTDMGYYLGIGGVLTFRNCKLFETLASIPSDCLVLETDAPYMSPVPHRGEPNQSRWMVFVAERLAAIYACTTEDIDRQTTANAKRLFRLP